MLALTLPTQMMRPCGGLYPIDPTLDDEEADDGSSGWDADLTPVVPSCFDSTSGPLGVGPMRRKRMWSGPVAGVAVPRPRPASMVFGAHDTAGLDDDDTLLDGSYQGTDDALEDDESEGDNSSDDAYPAALPVRRMPQITSPAIAIPRGDAGRLSAGVSPLVSGGGWPDVADDGDEAMEGGEAFVPPHLLSQRLTQSLATVPRRNIRHALGNWA